MKQMTLFDEPTTVLPVSYYPNFLSKEEADKLYQHCQELQWQQNQNNSQFAIRNSQLLIKSKKT
ncbi:2OG-Fe(II) oxygenase (plasmid) [Nostoc sp. HK-01]|nr:2OG-Fe(II) oxygenase [Nostoc sp. HK-01]